jgi:hypothetical protein
MKTALLAAVAYWGIVIGISLYAKADEAPQPGMMVNLPASPLCDTKEQIEEIYDAEAESFEKRRTYSGNTCTS